MTFGNAGLRRQTMEKQSGLKEDLAGLKHDLKTLRDELRLKMHLAGMELKTEWEKLEPEADRAWRDFSESSAAAAKELRDRLIAFKEQLKKH
jgi:hypothetical protein